MGAFIIVVGLYLIIWGKSKDSSSSSSKNNEIETFDIETSYLETSKDKDQDHDAIKARKEDGRGETNV